MGSPDCAERVGTIRHERSRRVRFLCASERECFLRVAVLKLGREATLRLYPDAAALLESSV